jgi:hypothetical protein
VTADEIKVSVEKYAWPLETKVLLRADDCESDPVAVPGEKSMNPAIDQNFAVVSLDFFSGFPFCQRLAVASTKSTIHCF